MKNQETYLEVLISGLPRTLEPALTSWLFRHGCWGTQQNLDFIQPNLKYEPRVRKNRLINISAFFDPAQKENVQSRLFLWITDHSPNSQVHWLTLQSQDWLQNWKKHFKSFTLSGLRFVPLWLYKKESLRHCVIISPGMAFGTGTHKTTQYATQLLQELKKKRRLARAEVLDVGAGSGILSIVAERFGAAKVLAIDNDPESWRECRKHFRINKTKACQVTKRQIQEVKKTYDVVVANIIDGVLMDLRSDLWRTCRRGGYIILSGVLSDGAPAFIKSFMAGRRGRVIKKLGNEEWTSFLIQVI